VAKIQQFKDLRPGADTVCGYQCPHVLCRYTTRSHSHSKSEWNQTIHGGVTGYGGYWDLKFENLGGWPPPWISR